MSDRLKSRKLWVTLGAFATGVILSVLGKLDQVTADFIVYIAASYMLGNVGNGVINHLKNR